MLEIIKEEVLVLLRKFLSEDRLEDAESCAHIYRCLQDRVEEFEDIPREETEEDKKARLAKLLGAKK